MLRHEIFEKLVAVRRRLKLSIWMDGVARLWLTVAGMTALVIALDFWNRFPQPVRWVALAMMLLLYLRSARRYLIHRLAMRMSDEDMAMVYERAVPELSDSLISSVQFHYRLNDAEHADAPEFSAQLARSQIERTNAQTELLDPVRAVRLDRMRRLVIAAVLTLIAAAGGVFFAPAFAALGLTRVYFPWRNVSWPTWTTIQEDRLEYSESIAEGDPWTVTVYYSGRKPSQSALRIIAEGAPAGSGDRYPLVTGTDSNGDYVKLAKPIAPGRDFSFDILCGDDRLNELRRVVVAQSPALLRDTTRIIHQPPDYFPTDRIPAGAIWEKKRYRFDPPAISGATGTLCLVQGRANVPMKPFTVRIPGLRSEKFPDGKEIDVMPDPGDPTAFTFSFNIEAGMDSIELDLLSADNLKPKNGPVTLTVDAISDQPPHAELMGIDSPRNVTAHFAVDDLKIGLSDDFGLTGARIEWRFMRGAPTDKHGVTHTGSIPLNVNRLALNQELVHAIDLSSFTLPDGLVFAPGDRLEFTVRVEDNHQYRTLLGSIAAPQAGRSRTVQLNVRTDVTIAMTLLREEHELLKRVEQLIETQEHGRRDAEDALVDLKNAIPFEQSPRDSLRNARRMQADVATGMRAMRKRLARLHNGYSRNRLANEEKEKHLTRMEDIASRLLNEPIPAAQRDLRDALVADKTAARVDALGKASLSQMDVLRNLREMQAAMTDQEKTANLLAAARRILADEIARVNQTQTLTELKSLPAERRARAEEITRRDKAFLTDAAKQNDIIRKAKRFEDDLKQALIDLKETDPLKAKSIAVALQTFVDSNDPTSGKLTQFQKEHPGILDKMSAAVNALNPQTSSDDSVGQRDAFFALTAMKDSVDGMRRVIAALENGPGRDIEKALEDVRRLRRKLKAIKKSQKTLATRTAAVKDKRDQLKKAIADARDRLNQLRKRRMAFNKKTRQGLKPKAGDVIRKRQFKETIMDALAKLIQRQRELIDSEIGEAGTGAQDILTAVQSLRQLVPIQLKILDKAQAMRVPELSVLNDVATKLAAADDVLVGLQGQVNAFVQIGAAPKGQMPAMVADVKSLRDNFDEIRDEVQREFFKPELQVIKRYASPAMKNLDDLSAGTAELEAALNADDAKRALTLLTTAINRLDETARGIQIALDSRSFISRQARVELASEQDMLNDGIERVLAIFGAAVRPPLVAGQDDDPGKQWTSIVEPADARIGEALIELDRVRQELIAADVDAVIAAMKNGARIMAETADELELSLKRHEVTRHTDATRQIIAAAGSIRNDTDGLKNTIADYRKTVAASWTNDEASGLTALDAAVSHMTQASERMGMEIEELSQYRVAAALPWSYHALESLLAAMTSLRDARRSVENVADPALAQARRERALAQELYALAETMRNIESQVPSKARPSRDMNDAGHSAARADQALDPPPTPLIAKPKPEMDKALASQKRSLQRIDAALEKMDQLAKDADKSRPEDFIRQLEKKQAVLRKRARELEDNLRKTAKEDGVPEADKAGDFVRSASGSQSASQSSMQRGKMKQSAGEQMDALDDFNYADMRLQDAERRLERQRQDDVLEQMEDSLRRLLAKQRAVHLQTANVEKRRTAEKLRGRRLRKLIADIMRAQSDIAGETRKLSGRLNDEGAKVFKFGMDRAVSDMTEAVSRLGEKRDTGLKTRMLQQDAVDRLAQLLEALREVRSQRRKGGGGGGGGKKNAPMIPPTAELKLLLAYQQEINGQTKTYQKEIDAKVKMTADQHTRDAFVRGAKTMIKLLDKPRLVTDSPIRAGIQAIMNGAGEKTVRKLCDKIEQGRIALPPDMLLKAAQLGDAENELNRLTRNLIKRVRDGR